MYAGQCVCMHKAPLNPAARDCCFCCRIATSDARGIRFESDSEDISILDLSTYLPICLAVCRSMYIYKAPVDPAARVAAVDAESQHRTRVTSGLRVTARTSLFSIYLMIYLSICLSVHLPVNVHICKAPVKLAARG